MCVCVCVCVQAFVFRPGGEGRKEIYGRSFVVVSIISNESSFIVHRRKGGKGATKTPTEEAVCRSPVTVSPTSKQTSMMYFEEYYTCIPG